MLAPTVHARIVSPGSRCARATGSLFVALIPVVVVMTALSAPDARGDLISIGQSFYFTAPHPPYDPEHPPALQVTFGYGQPSNTIGEGLWFSAPGLVDLSEDPDLPGFLSHATNGVDEPVFVGVTDQQGYESTWELPYYEGSLLGSWPDLVSQAISAVRLRAITHRVVDSSLPLGGSTFTEVRWEFIGVPEPSAFLSTWLGLSLLCTSRIYNRLWHDVHPHKEGRGTTGF